tara:strand:+ start:606 stop:719 length:114 start_codon:yes stop_codon:yes gene_type:complete
MEATICVGIPKEANVPWPTVVKVCIEKEMLEKKLVLP